VQITFDVYNFFRKHITSKYCFRFKALKCTFFRWNFNSSALGAEVREQVVELVEGLRLDPEEPDESEASPRLRRTVFARRQKDRKWRIPADEFDKGKSIFSFQFP